MRIFTSTLLALLGLVLAGPPAHAALLIECCTVSSDQYEPLEPTDPAQLMALFDFDVTDPVAGDNLFNLSLDVTNQTPVSGIDASFNINSIFLNGTQDVLSLTLVSVTDDIGGLNGGPSDATASWGHAMVPPGSQGAGTVLQKVESVGGMDDFRFSLWEGQGLTNPNVIQPGETSTFVFTVLAADGQLIDANSFDVAFINNQGNETGFSKVGAKFVSCTGADCSVPDDSAFGGGSTVVPEPGPAGLVLLGLAGLAQMGRRQRRT